MMDLWLSTTEILALRSAALPTDLGALTRRIEREGWRRHAPPRHRTRPGRGGGYEYHLSLLPAEAQVIAVTRHLVPAPPPRAPSPESDALWEAYDRLPRSAKDEAERRLAAVDKVELLSRGMQRQHAVYFVAADIGVSSSTLWEWLKLAQGVEHGDRLPALAPKWRGRTATVDCHPDAWAFLLADYLRPEKPAFDACHRRLAETASKEGWAPLPSARTLRRRLEAVPRGAKTLAREGREAAKRLVPAQRRTRAHFHALQALNADGHRFDVFVRWEDGQVARPVLLAFQDLSSGKLVGWRLDRTENREVVRLALADVVERYGVPEKVWFDNGRQFASKWLTGRMKTRFRFKVKDEEPEGILKGLGVEVHWTQPYSGQSKPIERAFKDLCEDIAKHPACAGAYTGNSPVTKPDNYGARALPIAAFRALVETEIARHNARTGRRGLGMEGRSFDEVFAQSLAQPTTIVRRASEAQRRLLLLAVEGVTARAPTGEIHLGDNRYHDDALVEVAGRRIVVRFDPQDLKKAVHVYTLDGRFLATAACIDDTGFDDIDAAKAQARRRADSQRAQRAWLEHENRLPIGEVARLLPGAPAPAPVPEPQTIRLVANGVPLPTEGTPETSDSAFHGAFGRAVDRLYGGGATVIPLSRQGDG